MRYRAVKQNDGTYSIQESVMGCNWSHTGLPNARGCNVDRVINKLIAKDYWDDEAKKSVINADQRELQAAGEEVRVA